MGLICRTSWIKDHVRNIYEAYVNMLKFVAVYSTGYYSRQFDSLSGLSLHVLPVTVKVLSRFSSVCVCVLPLCVRPVIDWQHVEGVPTLVQWCSQWMDAWMALP